MTCTFTFVSLKHFQSDKPAELSIPRLLTPFVSGKNTSELKGNPFFVLIYANFSHLDDLEVNF